MATFEMPETTRSGWSALSAEWKRRFRLWSTERSYLRMRRRTLRALLLLDDAMLADIGVERCDLEYEVGRRTRGR